MSVWDLIRLGELLDVQNGYAFSSEEFSEQEGVPLIRIRDLKLNVSPPVKFCGYYDERFLVNDGDLLVGMDGEFICYEWGGGAALLNQRVCRLTDFAEGLEPRFLLYGINKFLKEIEDATAYTTVKHLSSKTIKEICFPLPPLDEQKRIVAKLDQAFAALDRARANSEANLADSEGLSLRLKKDLIEKSVGGISMSKLGDVCEFVRGPFGGSLKKSIFKKSGFAVYEQQHAIHRRFDSFRYFVDQQKFEEMARFRVRPGEVIMSCSGTMGRVAVVPKNSPIGIINQALLKLSPSQALLPEFLKRWMESAAFQAQLSVNKLGVAIENVASVKTLKLLEVPLLSLKEQEAVVKEMDSIDQKSAEVRRSYDLKLADIATLRQSLLQAAFSGQLS